MTYIDAYHDRKNDQIMISERVKGQRVFNVVKAEYSFYYPDPKGRYTSIYGQQLNKFITNNFKKFQTERNNFPKSSLHESDIKPVFKTLEALYANTDAPVSHNASIDIEVNFCKERGFAPPEDPHQPITAITIGLDWLQKLVTLVIAPKTLTSDEAQKICDKFENCFLFDDERELLITFCDLIEDVDILYTWNGEGFDIPYIINRMTKILGKDYTKKLCLWDLYPKEREFERFGKISKTYDLIGRIHLDYLQLYRKFTYHEMHSYRLDAIAEYELGKGKVAYEGTLDQLYNNDFEKFIRYNREDTNLLTELDEKLKFISLVNTLAHDNCVLLPTTMGAVALTDQAIVLESHRRGFKVPDRQSGKNESFGIAGGYVADPKSGKLWQWIGSVDINSLYPSVIRALNMSPETLVGHVKHTLTDEYIKSKMSSGSSFADSWNNVFSSLEYVEIMNKTNTELTVYFEKDQEEQTLTAAEIYDWIFNDPNLCISANGTIFKTDVDGIIPGLLTKWYADRKVMQAKKKEFHSLYEKETDKKKKQEYRLQRDFWDQRQLATKIKLNSLYGAVSNVASRFADQRIGQSTTLTGRSITRHQNSKVNDILAGEYQYDGACIVYSDTDSTYFSIEPVLDNLSKIGFDVTKESFVELSDSIATEVNESFAEFLTKSFNIRGERSTLIKCGRENCITYGLYPSKKRYATLVYDTEGVRQDRDGKPGKLKIMGMDAQRADTPKNIQDFLKDILMLVLQGNSEDTVIDFIRKFRENIKNCPAWEFGMPKRVNNLTKYGSKHKSGTKGMIPGHVMASLNWNKLRQMNGDSYSMQIMDGQKVVVCTLKDNPLKMKSVAYPIDELRLPKWFTELPFDLSAMEHKLIDQKLDNVIGSLGWNLSASKTNSAIASLFTYE